MLLHLVMMYDDGESQRHDHVWCFSPVAGIYMGPSAILAPRRHLVAQKSFAPALVHDIHEQVCHMSRWHIILTPHMTIDRDAFFSLPF